MTVVLGVDGGGTKTHVLVADTTGRVLGSAVSGPSNWEWIGLLPAGRTIREAVEAALSSSGVAAKDIGASVFGLGGVDWPSDVPRLESIIHPIGLGGLREIVNDSFVALRAGASRPWGVTVIAGTGSIASGRNEAGEVFRLLGGGSAFGEFGSASDVSEEAVRAVAKAYTGLSPPTMLTELLCEAAECKSADELLERLSRRHFATREFDASKLAPIVVSAAGKGDAVASEIIQLAGRSLGESAALTARKLKMESLEFDVVLAGGLFRSSSTVLMSTLEMTLKRTAPRAKLVPLDGPPVVGAALMAMESSTGESHERVHSFLEMAAGRALRAA